MTKFKNYLEFIQNKAPSMYRGGPDQFVGNLSEKGKEHEKKVRKKLIKFLFFFAIAILFFIFLFSLIQ